jgi:DNA polymerase-1
MPAHKKRLVIIDGNALIHRAFHALPETLTTKSGEVVNAVYGFASVLLRMMKELKPDHIAATFDLPGKTFRHDAFTEYKAQRVKASQTLYDQIPRVKELVKSFSIPIYEKPGFEADDLIGTLSAKADGVETIIVTGDMDTLQLVDDHTDVYTMKKGIGEITVYDIAAVKERFGLKPNQLIDYKALRGDPSDNIPGVPGVGEKTATDLLQKFGTLDALYIALEKNTPKAKALPESLREKLLSQKEQAMMSRMLATIIRDVPVDFRLEDTAVKHYDRDKVVKMFQELEFRSLLPKLPHSEVVPQTVDQPAIKGDSLHDYRLVNDDATFKTFLEDLRKQKEFAVDTETTGLNQIEAKLLGLSFSWQEGVGYYVNVKDHANWLKQLQPILEDESVRKIGHNLKYDFQILWQHCVELKPLSVDTMVASYLLNPGSRQHNLDGAVFAEFGYEMQPIEALIGPKGKKQMPMDWVPVQQLAWYSAEDADYTFRLAKRLTQKLEKIAVLSLFEKVEMPLVRVLADMELAGVKLDSERLNELAKKARHEIAAIEKKIFKEAGTEFNVSSPLQLKEVLFEKMKISSAGLGKTKTGISTAADQLEKLRGAHPIVDMILEYRELAKVASTYLEALPKLVQKKTNRVHTSFNQTVAATGRLSSSEPNLQNIPIRSDWGTEIRKAFIADRGNRLLTLDYSQIELRIVASIANDPKMIQSFKIGEDIHARTAAEVYGIPLDKVSKNQRRAAKTINFGVLYGLGVSGLSQGADLSREEARNFIDRYFTLYAKVAEYLEETKALAHKLGYVETLFGRRRLLPEINSNNPMIRAGAERMAINHPIQGTAADLMKMAMVAIAKSLPQESASSRMTMQVHDELVFEVPTTDVDKVAAFAREEMISVTKLKVPIEVAVEVGPNWGEMAPWQK